MAASPIAKIIVPKNLAQAEAQLGLLAHATSSRRNLQAELDGRLSEVRAKYQERLDDLGKSVEDNTAAVESFFAANPGVFPEGKKSVELLHGTVGFRTGPPQLATLARVTWPKVLTNLLREKLLKYVRTKQEVDRAAILKDSAPHDLEEGGLLEPVLSREKLSEVGLKVVQEENFFVDLKN